MSRLGPLFLRFAGPHVIRSAQWPGKATEQAVILEPDVALSDFALALACFGFTSWLTTRRNQNSPTRAFMTFFAAIGTAALLGGVAHGFLPDHGTPLYSAVWTSILIAIGVATLASWIIGARLILSPNASRLVIALAAALFVSYVAVALLVSRTFAVAIVHYLPGAAFLLAAFVIAYLRQRKPFLAAGAAGVVLTFIAAGIQQAAIDLHPTLLSHNTLYHIVQGIALLLIFLAARQIVSQSMQAS